MNVFHLYVGLDGFGVTYSPRDPSSAGSNLAEVDEFFQDVKILSTNPPRGTRGNVLASRSEVRGFKPRRWGFSGPRNPEQKSSERGFKPWVPSLRFQTY